MKVIADFCIIPIGVGVSVSKYIAHVEKILKDAGLKTKLHAYGTNIEGEWDDVFAAIKKCHLEVHELGSPRISSTLRFGTRIDKEQSMDDKITSVESKLKDLK
ncbi:MAG: MTH1187 family thiamine-binding protein [Syntrophothermus sp.]